MNYIVPPAMLAAAALLAACAENRAGSEDPSAREPGEWVTWGGNSAFTRYSELAQIDAPNVARLEIAWRWQAEPLLERPDYNWKATPLYVGGVLYVATGGSKVAAIDPAAGETIWLFTPDPLRVGTRQFSGSTRAVSYWTDGAEERILLNSIDGRLFSIDAETGEPDLGFGVGGVIDLREDLLEADDPRAVTDLGSTGPGIVVGDVIVIQVISDDLGPSKEATPGYIRGYDVRTGERLWVFHTVPWNGEPGSETWEDESWRYTGNASVWTMMSADLELGYVYLPVESPTHNFWGGQRPGDGLFGESIVCLDARTGERIWHFQITHHGVWDYDLPAAPILHDIDMNGQTIKAVTVLTKQNMSFVFNRVTGEPIWPIEERPVPQAGAVPGERLSPTQPFPTRPAPYSRLGYHEEDLIDFTPEIRAEALEIAGNYARGPMYTPPSLVGDDIPTKGTIVYPGYGGGSNWNGAAVDEETNVMYVPTRNIFMAAGLREADPNLTDWRYVVGGSGGGFGTIRGPQGLPMNKPPWSLINATDMNTGEHIWSRSIGGAPDWVREHPALEDLELDFDNMGQISARPSPLVTKTLLFLAESGNIGGDPGGPLFRAYDKATGEVIAELELPGKSSGAPMTYMHEGRQYVAIAVAETGHPAELVALTLPRDDGRVSRLVAATDRAVTPSDARDAAPTSATPPDAREATPTSATPPDAIATTPDPIAATPEQLAMGRAVYGAWCSACHGPDGRGTELSNAPALGRLGSLDEVRNMVARGGAEMPGLGGALTAEEIDAVSRYLLLQLVGRSSSN